MRRRRLRRPCLRRLALVTLTQFREGLSDRQAAEAVRGRIDWKYALDLADAGFDYSVLCEFRGHLLQHEAGGRLLDRLLGAARGLGVLKPRGRQRTDSTHVLAAICTLNRLELVGETLRAALIAIATAAPEWLRAVAPADWHERYGRRVENARLPESAAKRELGEVPQQHAPAQGRVRAGALPGRGLPALPVADPLHALDHAWALPEPFLPARARSARGGAGAAEHRRLYAQRQGIEGTISQGVRAFGLRQARYRGLTKVGLQHVATAAAVNLDRLAAWLARRPLAPTRISCFAALAA